MSPHHHLLVVEDEKVHCDLLMLYFEHKGFRVTSACSEHSARVLAMERRFDLAIVDWNLSGTMNLDLVTLLEVCQPQAPIIIFTGVHDREDLLASALEGRVAAVVRKNGSLEALAEAVTRFLGGSRAT